MRFLIKQLSLPFLCVGIFLFAFLAGSILPIVVKSAFYTFSLTLKELLMFALPFIIFSFVFQSMGQMRDRALSFLIILLPMICASNFLSTNVSYGLGYLILEGQMNGISISPQLEALTPLWDFHLIRPISNDIALAAGILTGLVLPYMCPSLSERGARTLMGISSFILKRLFIPVMPLFILGFSLKLAHEQILNIICQHYLKIFMILAGILLSYVILLYGIAVNFRPAQWKAALKNMAPAAITGLSTMSSAAALPFMIMGSEKNVASSSIVRGIVPATVNVHLMGDCFAIPLFALSLLLSFGQGFPSYETYFIFALYFVAAKFAVAAVPGGGILVMLPVLERHLGFSSEMLSLITVLYVMFDPIITSANVMGNGAFAILFSRVLKRFFSKNKHVEKVEPVRNIG